MNLSVLMLAAVPVAWLFPNHYLPWQSAWQEGLAIALTFAAAVCLRRAAALPAGWAAAMVLVGISASLQWATGRMLYAGDLLMVWLYLGAFACAVALGATLAPAPAAKDAPALDAVATGMLFGAMLSIGIALMQWTGTLAIGIYGVEMPPGSRPFANVAQPNHLCTLVFLGLCSLALLRESGRIGGGGFAAAAAFLIFGMVMTSSRTGWLQLASAFILAAALKNRTVARVGTSQVAAGALFFAVLTLVWPALNEALLLTGGRGVMEQIQGGIRGPYWTSMIDAITHRPLWGYGWLQAGAAQLDVALDHAPILRQFSYSHNILIDLFLWAGVPIGATIIVISAIALARQVRAACNARAVWLLTGVAGLLIHAMLEYPLAYAYFLVPLGVLIGALHGLGPASRTLRLPPRTMQAAGVIGTAVLALLAVEYLEAEQNTTLLRLETARVGTVRIESKAPELRLLTQLRDLLESVRIEPRPNMDLAEIEQIHRVARRYVFANALYRYAAAVGLNGQPELAEETLARLCKIHSPEHCKSAKSAWQALQQRYPVLANVRLP